jgi:hypothetical protein
MASIGARVSTLAAKVDTCAAKVVAQDSVTQDSTVGAAIDRLPQR